jgi:DNA-binding transcriptional ArsR family regulator
MSDEHIDAVFSALGDRTRREVISRLTENGAMTATELAGHIPVSRQAIAKHLSSLSDAGLVAAERDGREVRYRLTPQPMTEAVAWMTEAGSEWDARLRRLNKYLSK